MMGPPEAQKTKILCAIGGRGGGGGSKGGTTMGVLPIPSTRKIFETSGKTHGEPLSRRENAEPKRLFVIHFYSQTHVPFLLPNITIQPHPLTTRSPNVREASEDLSLSSQRKLLKGVRIETYIRDGYIIEFFRELSNSPKIHSPSAQPLRLFSFVGFETVTVVRPILHFLHWLFPPLLSGRSKIYEY
jgi:hypothetical protein